jgi:hypothetical protein
VAKSPSPFLAELRDAIAVAAEAAVAADEHMAREQALQLMEDAMRKGLGLAGGDYADSD